jgi:DNA-binding MarR family transcriptional regulator
MPDPERPDPSDAGIAKTVILTERDMKDAARLFRLLADTSILESGSGFVPPAGASQAATPDRQSLISRARIVLNSRRVRRRYFSRDLFGEPAWEILLVLYITEESALRLTTSKLAEWVEAPLSTVVRWIKTLEEDSLVERVDHPTDRRIAFIRLLEKGRKALDAYLGAIPG